MAEEWTADLVVAIERMKPLNDPFNKWQRMKFKENRREQKRTQTKKVQRHRFNINEEDSVEWTAD